MLKLVLTLLFVGLVVVCNGSPLSRESSESPESIEAPMPDFFQKISEQCRNNTGSDDAFLVFMESFENAFKCVLKIDVDRFKTDFNQLTNATRTAFFTKYCAEARPLVSCFDDMPASVRPCVKENEFKYMEAFFESIPKTLDLACKNNGEIIFNMVDATRLKCFQENAKHISVCVDTYTESGLWNDDWNSELNQDKCSTLTNYRKCLMVPLDTCDLSDLIGIYDVSMNAMLRLSPCANNTEESTGETHHNNSTDVI
uniref:Putative secreted protein n=1 Tax=Anopheles braziliensis TaxID=58242 RepID=A0A2M3ZCM5_9DIPT